MFTILFLEEGSSRGKREKNITPAESGVGESIVSADSPGGESNAKQRDDRKHHQQQQQQQHQTSMMVAPEVNKCCVTPTRDMMSDGTCDDRVC